MYCTCSCASVCSCTVHYIGMGTHAGKCKHTTTASIHTHTHITYTHYVLTCTYIYKNIYALMYKQNAARVNTIFLLVAKFMRHDKGGLQTIILDNTAARASLTHPANFCNTWRSTHNGSDRRQQWTSHKTTGKCNHGNCPMHCLSMHNMCFHCTTCIFTMESILRWLS